MPDLTDLDGTDEAMHALIEADLASMTDEERLSRMNRIYNEVRAEFADRIMASLNEWLDAWDDKYSVPIPRPRQGVSRQRTEREAEREAKDRSFLTWLTTELPAWQEKILHETTRRLSADAQANGAAALRAGAEVEA